MGILLLLQVTYILTNLVISFIIIPNCGNTKGRTFKSPENKSKKSMENSISNKNCVQEKNKLIYNINKNRNVSFIGKVSEVKNSVDTQKSHTEKTKTTDKDKSHTIENKKNKKGHKVIVSMTAYNEEIERKLRSFYGIPENIIKNTDNHKDCGKEVDKKFKSIKKYLQGNKNNVDKKVIKDNVLNSNKKKIVKDTKALEKTKKKKVNVASDIVIKSKIIENSPKKYVPIDEKKINLKSSYAMKIKKNDLNINAPTGKKDSAALQEDDRYINLVELSIGDGIVNPDFVEVSLQPTQRSTSLTVDEEKVEQENLNEDQSNEEKYESLAAIQDLHLMKE
ncbi:Hypothetical protein SRAE_1000332500 [Strongyloides ratti]|uniref:Uncharacterized protein n=1 Tax=Strongyloides ratti TaxID=34506 RepID=A0A090L5S5_STRRB|nr:Hypothetical protein SRAE_1000332500 [Strongyloides ratti]CEF65072.1 Hypothetical protein SRAE_1000332500 [Strongyloides ratti]